MRAIRGCVNTIGSERPHTAEADGSLGVRRFVLNLIRISNVSTIVSCVILTAVNRSLTVAALMNVREDECYVYRSPIGAATVRER